MLFLSKPEVLLNLMNEEIFENVSYYFKVILSFFQQKTSKELSVRIVLISLCRSSGNFIVYRNMILGEEKPLLIFHKGCFMTPALVSPGERNI